MANPLFILASSSPRRLALLAQIGVTPDAIKSPNINEEVRKREQPRKHAERLALEKLNAIAPSEKNAFVLAADTVVSVGRRILPKAEKANDVYQCLKLLSGRRHHVYTAIALQNPQGKIFHRVSDSTVIFRQLRESDIESYVQSAEGLGKAGGYAIQGRAGAFIRFVSGSYSGIMGLPLFEVAQMLQGAGFRI